MINRDKRGRFTFKPKKADEGIPLIGKLLLGGTLVTTLFVILGTEYNERVEVNKIVYAAEVAPEAEEIIVEVKIDWDEDRIEKSVRETFADMPNTAVAVAKGESELKPDAYNPEPHKDKHGNVICYGSYGVMQVACVHMMDNPEALFDVETNLRVAHKVYIDSLARTGNGWLPWGAYTSGGWKKYL